MKIYHQLLRIDTVEEDGKFGIHPWLDEVQLEKLNFGEIFTIDSILTNMLQKIHTRRTELLKGE